MDMRTKFKIILKAIAITVGIVLVLAVGYTLCALGVTYMFTDIGRFVLVCMMLVGVVGFIFIVTYGNLYEQAVEEEWDNK